MTTDRKLASIRKIKEIRPIEGADRIVCAVVDGWELVTQKSNNFQVGDLVVYFEIDSLLPISEQFSFLEPYRVSAKNSVEGEGYRLKTIRLRGQLSQGLILPIDADMYRKLLGSNDFYDGMDVTELLGVKKYEKPIPANLAGKIRGNFPSFIPKTDQERIQNCFDKFYDKWRDRWFEATIKLDGSSCTYYFVADEGIAINGQQSGKFGVCSRNLDLLETDDNAFWQVARKYDIEGKMREISHGGSYAIQGELMGPGVQGNREQLTELDFFVYDIYDITDRVYLDANDRFLMTVEMGLKHVPVIDVSVFSGFDSVKKFLQYAERPSINNPQAEGVVFKCLEDTDISFKVISSAYLLAED